MDCPIILFFKVFPATFIFICSGVNGVLFSFWNMLVERRLWVAPVSMRALIVVFKIVIFNVFMFIVVEVVVFIETVVFFNDFGFEGLDILSNRVSN